MDFGYEYYFVLLRYPFDRKSFPVGFSIVSCCEILLLYFLVCTCGLSIAFLNVSRLMLIAFTADIHLHLKLFNGSQKISKNRLKTQVQFNEIIRFHSIAKQLSENFNHISLFPILTKVLQPNLSRRAHDLLDIYEFNFTAVFIWGLLTSCAVLLLLQITVVKYYIDTSSLRICFHCIL